MPLWERVYIELKRQDKTFHLICIFKIYFIRLFSADFVRSYHFEWKLRVHNQLTRIASTASILHHSIILGDISFSIHHCLSIYIFHFTLYTTLIRENSQSRVDMMVNSIQQFHNKIFTFFYFYLNEENFMIWLSMENSIFVHLKGNRKK